ncbi:MAG: NAD-dependent epimerase/dehydratase family protein [Bacteroidales bacterium]|nr:NAD-dependent epimerase/dehydratase family protein [Bacteroidales bacterium]
MFHLTQNALYRDDLKTIAGAPFLPWKTLQGSSLFISGATGMIGSCLVDAIMFRNQEYGQKCKVYVLSRDRDNALARFQEWADSPLLSIVEGDVNKSIPFPEKESCDYVLHLASNTHPVAYATDPIGTITANIIGTQNMLDCAVQSGAKRFLFASSNEIYGENRGDQELFDEPYLGYIDCNTLRAGYPESKRCGEALCQAYRTQKGLDVVIARLTRSFGPTLKPTDTKALTQFLKNGLNGENIILKSEGNQYYSYTYVADAVLGLLTILLKGQSGEAYNVADSSCDIRLKDLAQHIANISGTKVVFQLPDHVESAGFSKATKARLDGAKLKRLGWQPLFPLLPSLKRTLLILQEDGKRWKA